MNIAVTKAILMDDVRHLARYPKKISKAFCNCDTFKGGTLFKWLFHGNYAYVKGDDHRHGGCPWFIAEDPETYTAVIDGVAADHISSLIKVSKLRHPDNIASMWFKRGRIRELEKYANVQLAFAIAVDLHNNRSPQAE